VTGKGRVAFLALLLLGLSLRAAAAPGLADYAGFWSGTLRGFKGSYKVTLTLSPINKDFYGSYSVVVVKSGETARGTFVFTPAAGGCYAARINAPGQKGPRVSSFCPRGGGGVSFYLDALQAAVVVDMTPGLGGLEVVVSARQDELRGVLARKTPLRPAAKKKSTPERAPRVTPSPREGEKSLQIKKPPRL